MKKTQSVKGIIPVAMAFIIVLSLILIATTGIFWSKTSLSVSRLKRYQAINYAKAALREAAHRAWNPGDTAWNDDTGSIAPPTAETITIDGVPVAITVDTSGARIRVSARVNYYDIRL